MEKEAIKVFVEGHVNTPDEARELLNDVETLRDKYDLTIDLKIYQSLQGFYELT